MVMPVVTLANGNLQVQEYSLFDFLNELQKLIRQGYAIDFESNEGYPQVLGNIYICQLKKVEAEVETQEDTGEVTEVQATSKPGRKAKVQA